MSLGESCSSLRKYLILFLTHSLPHSNKLSQGITQRKIALSKLELTIALRLNGPRSCFKIFRKRLLWNITRCPEKRNNWDLVCASGWVLLHTKELSQKAPWGCPTARAGVYHHFWYTNNPFHVPIFVTWVSMVMRWCWGNRSGFHRLVRYGDRPSCYLICRVW